MAAPLRILILDRNRYRSLMIERTVSRITPDSMIARFSSGTDVVRELLSTHYDIAILGLEGVERPVDMVQAIRLVRSEVKLLTIGLPETPKRVIAAIKPMVDTYLPWDVDPGTAIPQPICRAIEEASGVDPRVAEQVAATEDPVPVG